MARWAVVGASSFFGTAFCAQLERTGESFAKFSLREDVFELAGKIASIKPRYVVNFAALNMVAESWKHWADYYHVNIIKVGALARCLAAVDGLTRFVQVSTPEVYGALEGMAMEDETPFRPSTPYAVSRAAADMDLACLHKESGCPVIFTRAANIYGPGQQPYRIVPRAALACSLGLTLTLDGGGRSERSFLHVEDAARGVHWAAVNGKSGRTYHFATKQMTRIRDIVDLVAAACGKTLAEIAKDGPERPGKDMAYRMDCSRSEAELLWKTEVSLDIGLFNTALWYRDRAEDYRGKDLGYHHRP